MITIDGLATVNAYVDGELIGANLLPRLRFMALLKTSIVALISLLLFLFGYLGYEKFVEQWIESHL